MFTARLQIIPTDLLSLPIDYCSQQVYRLSQQIYSLLIARRYNYNVLLTPDSRHSSTELVIGVGTGWLVFLKGGGVTLGPVIKPPSPTPLKETFTGIMCGCNSFIGEQIEVRIHIIEQPSGTRVGRGARNKTLLP